MRPVLKSRTEAEVFEDLGILYILARRKAATYLHMPKESLSLLSFPNYELSIMNYFPVSRFSKTIYFELFSVSLSLLRDKLLFR